MKSKLTKIICSFSMLFYISCAAGKGDGPSLPITHICKDYCDLYSCGSGSQSDPYLIYDYNQLQSIAGDLSSFYVLKDDIDASASWAEGTSSCVSYTGSNGATATCEGFEPIGMDGSEFTGGLDGAGYAIDNLYINRPSANDVGLFGQTSGASFEDIGITNVYINGNNRTGVLAGQIEGGTEVQSSYAEGSVSGGDATGGLVGQQVDGRIESSYARADVSILRSGSQYDAGGLVGQQDMGDIENSYATGNISGGGDEDNLGGLVGRNQGGLIENSYATGNLSGGGGIDDMGGLVGATSADSVSPLSSVGNPRIINSYAMGRLNGGDGDDRIGGLVGLINYGELRNNYAVGSVNGDGGSNRAGGLIGSSSYTSIAGNNYFVDGDSATGVGSSSSPFTSIVQATGASDAARFVWMRDTLDETLDTGLDWDSALDANGNPIWNNLNGAGFPCIASINFGRGGCPP